jgi:transposase
MKRLHADRSLARRSGKRHLLELSLVPGASVARIALDHRLIANILFKWRRQQLRELAHAAPQPATGLLPVTVMEPQSATAEAPALVLNASAPRKPRPGTAPVGVIEIDLPLGRVRLTRAVDLAAVRVVIDALSQR